MRIGEAPSAEDNSQALVGLAWTMTGLVGVMAVMGFLMLGGTDLHQVHAVIGYMVAALAVIAATLAWRVARARGSMGIFYHGLAIPVLLVVQIGLGEMGQKWVHVVLGVLLLIACAALGVLAARRPQTA